MANCNKATMADVAKQSGVSLQTVSRVVRGLTNVSDATRARVQAVINELGYEPNISAQILASGQSRSIGVVTVGDLSYGMQELFVSVEARARRTGRYVVSASAPENDSQELISALKYLQARGVLATVVMAQNPFIIPLLERTATSQGVLVMSGRHHLNNYVTIGFDQISGSCEITRHLLTLSDSIVHIAGPLSAQDAMERLAAYQQVCAEVGVPARWISANGWSPESGYRVGLELNPVPKAIYAASDQIAIGVLRALAERGFKVGKDYYLGGFDDIPEAAYLYPALTTVQQDFSALAKAIIDALEEIIAEKNPPAVEIPTRLVIRESTVSESQWTEGRMNS